MHKILAILLIAFLPVCTGLNCYLCSSGLTGCNDPFSASATNVTTTGAVSSNTYCMKTGTTNSLITRNGASSCVAIPFVFGIGIACCQTDLCNGAPANYQASVLVVLSFFAMLLKLH